MRFNLYEYKIDAVYKDEEETSFIMFENSIFCNTLCQMILLHIN